MAKQEGPQTPIDIPASGVKNIEERRKDFIPSGYDKNAHGARGISEAQFNSCVQRMKEAQIIQGNFSYEDGQKKLPKGYSLPGHLTMDIAVEQGLVAPGTYWLDSGSEPGDEYDYLTVDEDRMGYLSGTDYTGGALRKILVIKER